MDVTNTGSEGMCLRLFKKNLLASFHSKQREGDWKVTFDKSYELPVLGEHCYWNLNFLF